MLMILWSGTQTEHIKDGLTNYVYVWKDFLLLGRLEWFRVTQTAGGYNHLKASPLIVFGTWPGITSMRDLSSGYQ